MPQSTSATKSMENTEPLTMNQPNESSSPDDMENDPLGPQEAIVWVPYSEDKLEHIILPKISFHCERISDLEDPTKHEYFDDVANKSYARFNLHGDPKDLDDAISNRQKGLEITPDQVTEKPLYTGKLAGQLQDRFVERGDVNDLEEALSHLRDTIRIYTDRYLELDLGEDGNLAASYGSIGAALLMRFQHLGAFTDVEEAIPHLQMAIQFIEKDCDLNRLRIYKSGFLTNLGAAFQARFKHIDQSIDYEALENLRERVRLMEADKKTLAKLTGRKKFNELKRTFEELEKTKKNALEDLENAVSNQRDAVGSLQDGDENKPKCHSNLGNALLERFWCLHRHEDLVDAILHHQEAVQLTPDDDPSKPISLDNLASAFRELFYKDQDLKDLESTIRNQEKAIQLTRGNDPNKTDRLTNLSIALEERFKCVQDKKSLQDALLNAQQGANHPPGSPRTRFLAAIQWAKCAELSSIPPISAFQLAINLLPRIAWLGIPFTDQRTLLAEMGGHVHDAVAAAIRHHQYETAVEWAEHGRSIIWQNLLGLRTPLERLRVDYRQIADKLQDISQQLRRLSPSDKSLNRKQETPIEGISTYSKLAIEWDELVEEVRTLPGFEKFLQPKSFSELALAASEGPVIILNDHASRGDALILLPKNGSDKMASVMHIPLEGFKSDTSKKQLVELNRLLMEARVRSPAHGVPQNDEDAHNAEFRGILTELWEHVVEPVIKGLGWKSNTEILPRIWWCATGSFAFLPIHGAGDGKEQLTDYAVSSYTPTLSALLDQSPPPVLEDFRILAVAQTSASMMDDIPQAKNEVEMVEKTAGASKVHCLIDKTATLEHVLQKMKECHWIHLATHGYQNLDEPMKSGFILNSNKVLELSEIIKQELPKADFAWLSACETAMGDEKLAEESIHLAAGMLFAGYRGVIGSMWSISDATAPVVTKKVYSTILEGGTPNRKGAATALHKAVVDLVNSNSDCVLWLPFIHIGR